MNPRQTRLIRTSYRFYQDRGEELLVRVLRDLRERRPGLASLIQSASSRRRRQYVETLTQIVSNCDRFGRLHPALGEIGARAGAGGLRPGDYAHLRAAVMAVMAEMAGHDWSDDLHGAWSVLLDAICGAMLAGADPARAAA
jgi:hemoglobin-like flavoprotein